MKTVNEGLRLGDLKGMVRNIISVDEYQSKVDDSAVVVAFFVTDRHAAADVNRFLQKSHVDLLDAEVSAAPDQRGDYLVFIEIPINDKAGEAVYELCKDLSSLAAFSEWKVRIRGQEESEAMPADRLKQYVQVKMSGLMSNFFAESYDDVKDACSVADFGSFSAVMDRNKLYESAIDLSSQAQRECRRIKALLGVHWNVEKIGQHYAVYENSSDKIALLNLTK